MHIHKHIYHAAIPNATSPIVELYFQSSLLTCPPTLNIFSAFELEIPRMLLESAAKAFTDPCTSFVNLEEYIESTNSVVSAHVTILKVSHLSIHLFIL